MALRTPRSLLVAGGLLVATASLSTFAIGLPASHPAAHSKAVSPAGSAAAPSAPHTAERVSRNRPTVVTGLGHLREPDLLLTAKRALTAAQVGALHRVKGVSALTVLDVGTVRVGRRALHVTGVDPSTFRAFTPKITATSDPLWAAVGRGDVAASYAAKLPLGRTVSIAGTPLRVGAIAAYDLPGTDLVVDHATARRLRVPQNSALVAAPGRDVKALQREVRAAVGAALEITVLRPATITHRRPSTYRELYIASARYCPGLSWTVLAAIGQVESGHGRNVGPSSAGALGPMQFMPATWAYTGVDGDGDGKADIMSAYDAVPSAALYLCRNGAGRGGQDLYNSVFAYNHADWYVRQVLGLAARYS